MKKKLQYIIAVLTGIAGYRLLSPSPDQKELFGSIGYYLLIVSPTVVSAFAGYSISKLLMGMSSLTRHEKQTLRCTGIIKDFDYSSMRVNGKPRFDIRIAYHGNTKVFKNQESRSHLKLTEGDRVVIFANPKDINDAFLDLDASIKLKEHSLGSKP